MSPKHSSQHTHTKNKISFGGRSTLNKNSINPKIQSRNYSNFGSSKSLKYQKPKRNSNDSNSSIISLIFGVTKFIHSPFLIILVGYSLFNVFVSGISATPIRQSKASEIPQIKINYNQSVVKPKTSK